MKRAAHILLGLALWAGGALPAGAVNMDAVLSGRPAATLSAYGLFEDGGAQRPAKGVLPYDLITPLFSDYAEKRRFVFVPEGKAASYDGEDIFSFPVGSVLVKTFAYKDESAAAAHGLRLIETRLLIHGEDGWHAYPYVWNEAQSEAVLKVAGARMEIPVPRPDGRTLTARYAVPNVNQCKGCHVSGKTLEPIGPKARNLNHDFAYESGPANQLSTWQEAGILTSLPEGGPGTWPRVPDWSDPEGGGLAARARAYLDVNCAHCHKEDGPAKTSGLFLTWQEQDPAKWGVHKRPVAAGRGSGGLAFDIAPGDPEASILHYRMNSADPGIMMPELGRSLIHEEGVALIRAWIEQM